MAEEKKDSILRRQIEQVEIRAINEAERSVEFVASNGTVDSYGTVLKPDGWDLSRFRKNGVIGYQHDIYYSDDPDNVIGRGEARVENDQLLVKVYFEPAELNRKADKVFRKVVFGSISGVSVGFSPERGHWGDRRDGEDPDVYYYDQMTLMEISVVNVPSNPDAVKRSIAEERAALEAQRKKPEAEQPDAEQRDVEENEKPADEVKTSNVDDVHIRLTIARAKRQLAN